MTEEIKKILEQLQKYLENEKYYEKGIISGSVLEEPLHLRYLKVKILLNYITNLQKENEKLKEIINDDMTVYLKGLEDGKDKMKEIFESVYKSRNEKAVEYINNLRDENAEREGFYNCFPDDLYIANIEDLLNILEGGDE